VTEKTETIDAGASAIDQEPGWEWAILEIFGHRKHAGRIREEERFGTKMLRIDIPIEGDPAVKGWRSHYYSGGSIFSLSLTDEASVLAANAPYRPASRLTYAAPDRDEEEHDDDSDNGGSYD
jgi:hypothetical protein